MDSEGSEDCSPQAAELPPLAAVRLAVGMLSAETCFFLSSLSWSVRDSRADLAMPCLNFCSVISVAIEKLAAIGRSPAAIVCGQGPSASQPSSLAPRHLDKEFVSQPVSKCSPYKSLSMSLSCTLAMSNQPGLTNCIAIKRSTKSRREYRKPSTSCVS